MPLSWDEIQANAIEFSKRWESGAREKQEAQSFVRAFLGVFGVDTAVIDNGFEAPVKIGGQGHSKYIDFLWEGRIAIEMKSKGEDLAEAFKQLQRYMNNLPNGDDVPDLWLVCDFENMRLNRRSTNDKWSFKTKELRRHIKKFADIAGYKTERVHDGQIEVNKNASEKMAKLYDELKSHGYDGHDLEVYLVRLLFCMFADDTNIFPQDSFYKYVEDSKPDGSDLSHRIADLFEVLNMPDETRAKRTLLSDELKQFRYINGGLFENILPRADFNEKMRQTLLECCNYDWNKISPAIFGSMFQGVMDKEKRREIGAHYTSEENILKLINPLFMDGLWSEFDRVKTDPVALGRFHDKISGLKFLDPACGCGNFLIITYRELRLLELEILKMKIGTSQMQIDISGLLKVSVEQFYGIEYEDFPCQIATVGMWLIDHQMNLLASDLFGTYYARLPLTQSATIVHGNALRLDWESVVPKHELSYILGNPPFLGSRYLGDEQRKEIAMLFPKNKTMDYVCAWYVKAGDYMKDTTIKTAFVSTCSITQGEQVPLLWKPLIENGIYINFGVPTFKWSNEAKGKAAVHCVIIGFSYIKTEPVINPYLLETPIIFIESRTKPLCDAPAMRKGNQLTDGLNLVIEANEYADFIAKEPMSKPYIKRLIGADEYINNKLRYCLWLKDCSPGDLRKMPLVMERVERTRQWRNQSRDEAARRIADTPTLFREMNNPDNFIVVPVVSSEKRRYIPIGFMHADTIASNAVLIIPDASLYHFGILTSNVHNAWTRAVCGRLEMRYRYSKDIVYNNFPWVCATDEQKAEIERLAQAVLDARAQFPGSSLADLYDPLTMPPELLKAHKALDKAVWKLYGFTPQNTPTEQACVAKLMERYLELAKN